MTGAASAQQTITYTNGQNDSSAIIITSATNPTTLTISSGSAIQSGVISQSGTSLEGNVVKSGAGMLTLSAANTYIGVTTINAGTLAISSGGSLADSSGVNLANRGTTFDISNGGSQTIQDLSGVSGSTLSLGGNTLTEGTSNLTTFAGTIQGSGGLIKTNTGKLVLTGPNTYTGGTVVSGGTLQFEQESSLYDGQTASWTAANIGISSGATLALNVGGSGEFTPSDVTTFLQNLGSGTGGFASGSAIGFDTTNSSGGVFTYSGNITNTNSGNNTLGLVKLGSGTLSLTGINTYSGPTTITAGTLQVNGSLAAGSTVGVGSAGTLSGSGTVNGNATLTGNGVINLTSSGNIAGTLSVTGGNWNGAGAVAGQVTLSSGTFTIGSGANLTANDGVNVTGSGSIASGALSSTITGSLNYTSTSNSGFSGVIAGDGNTVTVNNSQGYLTLYGTNTYTGATTVTAGTLSVGGSTSAASTVTVGAQGTLYPGGGGAIGGSVYLNGGLLIMNSATIDGALNIAGGTWEGGNGTVHGQVTVSSGQFTLDSLSSMTALDGLFITGGTITSGNSECVFDGSLTYTSPLSSTFAAEILGANSVTLDNPSANLTISDGNYTGPTTIKAGTLTVNGPISSYSSVEVDSGATLAGSGSVNGNVTVLGGTVSMTGLIGGTVTVNDGATFNGAASVYGQVTSTSGIFTVGSGADLWAYGGLNITGGTLAAGNASSTIIGSIYYASSASSTFGGIIYGTGNTVTMNNASGTLTLYGSNSYTGGTTITAGTLLANSGNSTGSGAVTVNSGGFLGGTGTINPSGAGAGAVISIASGGTLIPSYGAGISTLTLALQSNQSVNLLSGAKLAFDLGVSGVSDQVKVTGGTLTLNSQNFSDFNFTTLGTFTGSGTYDLIVTDGSGDITGSLGTTTGSIGAYTGTLSVLNSQDLVLTVGAVPEPSTWAMLLGGLGLLAFWRAHGRHPRSLD